MTFTATGTAGAADAAQSTLTPASATITADGTSTQVLTVTAKDANGNTLTSGGAAVTIVEQSGSGTIGSVSDNGDGTYTAIVTSPTTVGSGVFAATLGGSSVNGASGSQTQVTVNYVAGAATQIALNAGDAQVAVLGTAVAIAPSVLVKDTNNNPVCGVSVTFAVASGGGSRPVSPTTNASGIATVGSWTLGTTAGANTLTATSTGLSGSPVTFSATGITIGTPYGGGVVGYILQSGDPGYVAGQTHGLVAATADQSTGIIWALPAYQSTAVGGTGTAIGTGLANTNAIIPQNGVGITYAAGLARSLQRWRLRRLVPAQQE